MPISDFRKKKLMYVFKVFIDVNGSGTIDKKDFDLAIEKICKMRGWQDGNPKIAATREILLKVWEGLKTRADQDHDGQVSQDEWCTMWDEFARQPESALEWQNSYMNFMFDLEDESGDGCIDEDEFTAVCMSYGIGPDEAKIAFSKFSQNGTIEVTRNVFANYWQEFFASEDPNAPGNFIFGKTTFD